MSEIGRDWNFKSFFLHSHKLLIGPLLRENVRATNLMYFRHEIWTRHSEDIKTLRRSHVMIKTNAIFFFVSGLWELPNSVTDEKRARPRGPTKLGSSITHDENWWTPPLTNYDRRTNWSTNQPTDDGAFREVLIMGLLQFASTDWGYRDA